MLWLVVAGERKHKQALVANALQAGISAAGIPCKICVDDPPVATDPFIAVGQLWVVERIIPRALKLGAPFWLVDNGYYKTSGMGNQNKGHYEVTYKSLAPILLKNPNTKRNPATECLKPWRETNPGKHVLIGMPGTSFGRCIGMHVEPWMQAIEERVKKATNRKILVRNKWSSDIPLDDHLKNAHCVVTHSSNIAVDATWRGVPAICEKWCPTWPISSSLDDLENSIQNPLMPDRTDWWNSLMCQQYTLREMAEGLAWKYMLRVQEQTDGHPLPSNWIGS